MPPSPKIKDDFLDAIVIRPFKDQDLEALTDIQKSSWENFYEGILPVEAIQGMVTSGLQEKWKQRMQYPMPPLDLAVLDDSIIGSICYGPSLAQDITKNTQLYSLFVHPDYWGRGVVGKALLDHVKKWCHTRGCHAIEGWLSPKNDFVHSFMTQEGFRQTDQKRIVMHGGVPLEEVLYVLPL